MEKEYTKTRLLSRSYVTKREIENKIEKIRKKFPALQWFNVYKLILKEGKGE